MPYKSQKELYDLAIQELQSLRPDLTDTNEGSIIDVLTGVKSVAVAELIAITLSEFEKTFFDTSHGPEITGGPDDLQKLAVDKYGDDFARPGATQAVGTVTFSRLNADFGDVLIETGTIVKTKANAAGNSQRFEILADVLMEGISINASARALLAGPGGNVLDGEITEIETTLLDSSITVTNALSFSGGSDQQSDSEYRETIRNKIESMKGSSVAAIEAKAKTVPGVAKVRAIEIEMPVIEFDIATQAPKVGAKFFRIAFVSVYVADANGTASSDLLAAVKTAVSEIRAGGSKVVIRAASALAMNWTAAITLNPSGPNYAELSADAQMIRESMAQYINELPIGTSFVKADADLAMLAIYGPSGSGDLTGFTTLIPSGDIAAAVSDKLIAQNMGTS